MKGKSKREELRSRPASRKRIDSHAVKWIVGGNLERIDSHAVKWIVGGNLDARYHLRTADRKTLEAALFVFVSVLPITLMARRKLIETRLRKLDKEAAK